MSTHTTQYPTVFALPGGQPPADAYRLSWRNIAFFLRQRWMWILAGPVLVGALAAAYLWVTKPTYVAATQLLVEFTTAGDPAQNASAENAFVEGQIEVARSTDVLAATASALDLIDDPDFTATEKDLRRQIKSWLLSLIVEVDRYSDGVEMAGTILDVPSVDSADAIDPLYRAVARLRELVSLRRVGGSMIIEITASGHDPELAAKIANSLAAHYIEKNLAMKADGARHYSEWLGRFVAEQQSALAKAAAALAAFKGGGTGPRNQFQLAELESAANAQRALYENTLTEYTKVKQRISYPMSDATVISNATPPLTKARPRSGLVLAFALLLGAGLGLMSGLARHAGDKRLHRADHLAELAQLPFVVNARKTRGWKVRRLRSRFAKSKPGAPGFAYLRPTIPGIEELGAFVSALRRKKVSLIGLVPLDPGSGASSIALELALFTAASGCRTLLVDAAPNGDLSLSLLRDSGPGLGELLEDSSRLSEAFVPITDELVFLPLGSSPGASPAARLGSQRTALKLEDLKSRFDMVIVDLAAFSTTPDVRAIAPELDGILLVASHGRSGLEAAASAVDVFRTLGGTVLGAIVNKVPRGHA